MLHSHSRQAACHPRNVTAILLAGAAPCATGSLIGRTRCSTNGSLALTVRPVSRPDLHIYILASGSPPSTVEHSLAIGAKTGLPRRHVLMESYGAERTTFFDYYDYGALIHIPPPLSPSM